MMPTSSSAVSSRSTDSGVEVGDIGEVVDGHLDVAEGEHDFHAHSVSQERENGNG